MMLEFSRDDFQKLVELLSQLEEFRTETSRWRLIDDVLAGSAREHDVRGLLDLSGKPRGSAVSLVNSFLKFGQVQPGKELIGILANKLLDSYVFDPEPVAFLRGLFTRYPLDKAVAPQAPVTDWKGDDAGAVLEKIIGENTLRDIVLLELGLEAAKSVVRIRAQSGLGSGFLCGEGIIMTNHHVIPDAVGAGGNQYMFFYELDRHQQEKAIQTASTVPEGLFFSDERLDVSLIQVKDVPAGVEPLKLKKQRMKRDQRVNIIQHPGGHYKKISMQNNFVEYADSQVLQYSTSTEPGSSGSPVFDNDFNVVAIHHSGGMVTEPTSGRRYLRNAGTTMIAILNAVEQNAPRIYEKLNIAG